MDIELANDYFIIKNPNTDTLAILPMRGAKYSAKLNAWIMPRKKVADGGGAVVAPIVAASTPTVPPVEIYTCHGLHGELASDYATSKLFKLAGKHWDSVTRYMLWIHYKDTPRGDAIATAENLIEAKRIFKLKKMVPKTPREIIEFAKIESLINSAMDTDVATGAEFVTATRAKFAQNNNLMAELLQTAPAAIICRQESDTFGYCSNLLGTTCMTIRDGQASDPPRTNNMAVSKAGGELIVRGNASAELATALRGLGTYKQSNGTVVYGKLDQSLSGGPGWVIPMARKKELKECLFPHYTNIGKVRRLAKSWLRTQAAKILAAAGILNALRGKQEIGSDDILFVCKDIYNLSLLNGDLDQPAEFAKLAGNTLVSDAGLKLLWNVLNGLYCSIVGDLVIADQIAARLKTYNDAILDTKIQPIENITDRETLLVRTFLKLWGVLSKAHEDQVKVTIAAAQIILQDQYPVVKEIYSKKIKNGRLEIKNKHINIIDKLLPETLAKKCKLLFYTMLDFIMDPEHAGVLVPINLRMLQCSGGDLPVPTTPRLMQTVK